MSHLKSARRDAERGGRDDRAPQRHGWRRSNRNYAYSMSPAPGAKPPRWNKSRNGKPCAPSRQAVGRVSDCACIGAPQALICPQVLEPTFHARRSVGSLEEGRPDFLSPGKEVRGASNAINPRKFVSQPKSLYENKSHLCRTRPGGRVRLCRPEGRR
jgi:hypothetical protein